MWIIFVFILALGAGTMTYRAAIEPREPSTVKSRVSPSEAAFQSPDHFRRSTRLRLQFRSPARITAVEAGANNPFSKQDDFGAKAGRFELPIVGSRPRFNVLL